MCNHRISVVSQDYSTRANDVYVILGNSALLKCEVPSFVTDLVTIASWVDGEGQEYFANRKSFGILD